MNGDLKQSDGRILDSAFGLNPFPKKPVAPPKEKPAFPSRALRDAPRQAPIIVSEMA